MIAHRASILACGAILALWSGGVNTADAREPLRARSCDVRRLAERALRVELKMSSRRLEDTVVGTEFRGYLLSGDGAFDEVEDPGLALADAFDEAGWVAVAEYQTDGADGTAGAYEKPGIRCLYEIGWNGHVDGEPDSLASAEPARQGGVFRVNIFCYRPPIE